MKVLGVFRKSMLGFFFQVCAKGHSVWRKRPFNPQLCGRYFGRILSFSKTCSLSFGFESWHWWSNWWQAYNWVWSLKQGSSTLKSFWYIWAEKTETKDGYYIHRKKGNRSCDISTSLPFIHRWPFDSSESTLDATKAMDEWGIRCVDRLNGKTDWSALCHKNDIV